MAKYTTVVDAKLGVIQVTAELVIKNFVDVMAGFEPGMKIESDPFNVGDTPMAIRVFLNGHDEDHRGKVGVFLRNYGNADIRVKCQFITEVRTIGFGYARTVEAGKGCGIANFLGHARCTEAYKDKQIIFTAKVEFPGAPVKIAGIESGPAPKKQKLNVFEKVYNTMEESDFALIFDGEEVPCHKIVLAAASPVFKAMVKNKHREAIEGKSSVQFSREAGRAFVQYIYTGKVQEDLLKEHAAAFLAMGELYDLQELKDMAENELLIQLDKENMVAMISVGDIFKAEKIFEAALKMARANMTWLRNQVRGVKRKMEINLSCMNMSKIESTTLSGGRDGGVEEAEQGHHGAASLRLDI